MHSQFHLQLLGHAQLELLKGFFQANSISKHNHISTFASSMCKMGVLEQVEQIQLAGTTLFQPFPATWKMGSVGIGHGHQA